MENLISKEKIAKYRSISSEALEKAKVSINKEKKKEAAEIIEMVSCYLSDSNHFESKGDYVNAFAALSYAHGWLDAGARLKIFKVTDNRLFTV